MLFDRIVTPTIMSQVPIYTPLVKRDSVEATELPNQALNQKPFQWGSGVQRAYLYTTLSSTSALRQRIEPKLPRATIQCWCFDLSAEATDGNRKATFQFYYSF